MKKIILLNIILCVCLSLTAQEKQDKLNNRDGIYRHSLNGISIASFRDKGTSPLLYNGIFITTGKNYSIYKNNNLWQGEILIPIGVYIKSTKENLFLTPSGNLNLMFSYERNLHKDNPNLRHYLGGSIENSAILRFNSKLMNASFTFNNISNLNVSYAFEYDFKRKAKDKKLFGFIRYHRKEKQYFLRTKVSLPLLSVVYHPGYTHVGNATEGQLAILNDYQINGIAFAGLSTDISLVRQLQNGNQWKLSYRWSAFSTKNAIPNRLDMSNHIFFYSYIIKLK